MDQQELRKWGLIGGAVALVVALGLATYREQPQTPAPEAQIIAQPPDVSGQSAIAPIPSPNSVEPAAAGKAGSAGGTTLKPIKPQTNPALPSTTVTIESAENPNLEFIVRVGPTHPLFPAQDLYERGQRAQAALTARATIQQHKEFNGLCFENFTLGAEIVLSHCAFVQAPLLKKTGTRWAKKLRAMPDTTYAEENVILHPESRSRQ
jgi:hypothetical protein